MVMTTLRIDTFTKGELDSYYGEDGHTLSELIRDIEMDIQEMQERLVMLRAMNKY